MKNFTLKNKWQIGIPLLSLAGVAGYLITSMCGYGAGYPLDDAWIHLTYARNLIMTGEWMFFPGILSGGSTSPLWTVLLTPAFLLQIAPVLWTSILAILSLSALGYLAKLFLEQQGINANTGWLAAVVILEWHFVWAALSGMETLLQSIGNLAVAVMLFIAWQKQNTAANWFLVGLLIGALIWVRPEGLTWMGPAFVLLFATFIRKKEAKKSVGIYLIVGFMLPFAAYLLFNEHVAGSMWPTTMYAKQAEYQSQLSVPFLTRIVQLFALPFIGSSILLLPGIIYLVVHMVKTKNILLLVYYLWWIGMVILYATKLPVTYQHGRYMIPVMIIPILCGITGTIFLFQNIRWRTIWKNRLVFASLSLWIGLQLAFYGLGAKAYREDVGIIETEMVRTAQWVAEHIPYEKRLAVHDIGAMGYFSGRKFIDLAGLINPEVIPIIRDEEQLVNFLNKQDIDYVISFPNWYPTLLTGKEVLYSTQSPLSPSLGGDNMTVFCWKKCQ
jgi:hypothetical protein